jgi:DNA-directed RNA polymerase subunit E'
MFMLVRARDLVRVPPSKFSKPLESAVLEGLRAKYENRLVYIEDAERNTRRLAIVVAIVSASADPLGILVPGDGASYHNVEFEFVAFSPFVKEVVEGEVVSVTRAGLYVNLGVIDGFIHINQVSDEHVTFDTATGSLLLEESRRRVERGDVVRARVYTMGILPGKGIRIHMTMRQPGLGKLEWIKESKAGKSK